MGKVLRVLVIVLAVMAIGATVLAYINYNKREVLIARTHLLEEYVVKFGATIEEKDAPETVMPAYPERDISDVTSREVENPERASFWSTYNHKYEPPAESIPKLDYRKYSREDGDGTLAHYYRLNDDGTPDINPNTGKPYTTGEGTMDFLLGQLLTRARAQVANLANTRAELPKLRDELIKTIEELNRQKQDGRQDKRTIEERDSRIATLQSEKQKLEGDISELNESLRDEQQKSEDLADKCAKQEETVQKLEDRIKQLEFEIAELKGNAGTTVVPTSKIALEDGVLTPGDKGEIVAFDDERKFAIIRFTPAFMSELLGPERERALPQAEVMVRRAKAADGDSNNGFVTRLRLRQAIREKDIVIADILSDWQQQPVQKGDIVFY